MARSLDARERRRVTVKARDALSPLKSVAPTRPVKPVVVIGAAVENPPASFPGQARMPVSPRSVVNT